MTLVIATSGANSGGISSLGYTDGTGAETSINTAGSKFSFTQAIPAKDGDFIFVTACTTNSGINSTITVRVLNNGGPVAVSEGIGTDKINAVAGGNGNPGIPEIPARPACASIEAFANAEDPETDSQ